MKSDKNSPPAGEAGEHDTLRVYVNGNWDVGTINLNGWTLIANTDLNVERERDEKLTKLAGQLLSMANDLCAGHAVDELCAGIQEVNMAAYELGIGK